MDDSKQKLLDLAQSVEVRKFPSARYGCFLLTPVLTLSRRRADTYGLGFALQFLKPALISKHPILTCQSVPLRAGQGRTWSTDGP